jgi:hypothetical protein
LSSLALAASAFVDTKDSQERFEATRERLAAIRRAVAGQPQLSAGGEAAVGGFVADMGRLPRNLNELFTGGYCSDPAYISQTACVGTWSSDAVFGTANICSDAAKTSKTSCESAGAVWVELSAGWRGTYLHAMPESGGMIYRDGWGNGGNVPGTDFGWNVAVADIDGSATPDDFDDTLTVRSTGSDGALGGLGYAADYPAAAATPLVDRKDHNIDLTGGIRVRLINPGDGNGCSLPLDGTGTCTPSSSTSVCLRIYYPGNGAILSITSDPLPLTDGLVADGSSKEITFNFPSTGRQWIPWGVRAVGVFNHSGSCGNNAYPSATVGPAKTVTLLPRTSLPVIDWRMQ